jgi:methylthioribulose-1-phosphate dehydratase
MASLPDISPAAREIIAAGKDLALRGQVPATSGNFSRRLNDRYVAITASGADKGALTKSDVLLFDLEADALVGPGTASAETPLHVSLYRIIPSIGAVLHTHSKHATLVSMLLDGADRILLSNYELLKAFRGFTSHTATAEVPLFDNDQDMNRLSALVEMRLKANAEGVIGYLLAGHGLYTWGVNMAEARCHIEALEFILDCEFERMRLKK